MCVFACAEREGEGEREGGRGGEREGEGEREGGREEGRGREREGEGMEGGCVVCVCVVV